MIQRAILENRLQRGARLPSTRIIASQIGVSRNTVISAFEQIIAEGYASSSVGSGTRVVEELPDDVIQLPKSDHIPAKRLHSIKPIVYQLSPSLPAVDAFPHALWRKITKHIIRKENPANYYEPQKKRVYCLDLPLLSRKKSHTL